VNNRKAKVRQSLTTMFLLQHEVVSYIRINIYKDSLALNSSCTHIHIYT